MKKMNNTKTTKVSKKARIGIAALAAIMTMSFAAPLAANAATLPEGQSVVCMALNDTELDNSKFSLAFGRQVVVFEYSFFKIGVLYLQWAKRTGTNPDHQAHFFCKRIPAILSVSL